MRKRLRNYCNFCVLIIFVLGFLFTGPVSAIEYENTGQGKPRAMDIYFGDIPYSASLGGAVKSAEKGVGDFKVIIDDDKVGKEDPTWFIDMGAVTSPTPTPTMAPTPTTTVPIPVDKGGVGAKLCVTDATTDVIIDFAYSSAGYKNMFYLVQPRYKELGWSKGEMPDGRTGTPFGTTWNLGSFPVGTELIFADNAFDGETEKGLYLTGPASRNSDNYIHAAITLKNSTGTHHKYLVSFEDYMGGGDNDYNDVEFFVSGDVTTGCSLVDGFSGDSGGGAIVPVYMGNICRCGKVNNKDTCIAQFSYNNTAGTMTIPVRSKSLPWNEFTGSGWTSPTKQYHCQPEIFYINSSENSPFWTSPFWNNIDWKLGHAHSASADCTKYSSKDKPGDAKYIPDCSSLGITCSECA